MILRIFILEKKSLIINLECLVFYMECLVFFCSLIVCMYHNDNNNNQIGGWVSDMGTMKVFYLLFYVKVKFESSKNIIYNEYCEDFGILNFSMQQIVFLILMEGKSKERGIE
jgi:Na+/pantothenate symporter